MIRIWIIVCKGISLKLLNVLYTTCYNIQIFIQFTQFLLSYISPNFLLFGTLVHISSLIFTFPCIQCFHRHAVSGQSMLIHTYHAVPLPRTCRNLERSLSERHIRGTAVERHGICQSNTAALCKSNRKDTI
jgi:hypothetical protein